MGFNSAFKGLKGSA